MPFHLPDERISAVLLANLDALYSAAYRLCGRADLAEDLVQETARKALQAASTLHDERNLRGWLFKILINAVRDHLRRRHAWEEWDESERIETGFDVESLSHAAAEDVRDALDRLGPARRALVILVDLEGFTINEAAGILRIPPGTAASRLARAHAQLREALKDYGSRSSRKGGQK